MKQPNSDPVLSLPTTADMARIIFTRQSKRGKGLETTWSLVARPWCVLRPRS